MDQLDRDQRQPIGQPAGIAVLESNVLAFQIAKVAQAVPATGAWFIVVPLKFVNFAGAWQPSQAAVPTGMCVPGGVTIVTP